MSNSFGMKSARDCLEDFRRKVVRYRADDLNESLALDCAMAGWSLVDWVFDEYVREDNWSNTRRSKELLSFKQHLKRDCPSLDLLQDIANARKHRRVENYGKTVLEARSHSGGFSSGFSRGFNISRLIIVTADREFDFEDTVVATLDCWDRYFDREGLA
ncbi:MAG: hypothetical protein ACFB01_10515 [Cohaesibacteraceae bacterium]